MAQDAVLAGWNKIGSAIDNFVETGKFKFSDFARSVIADFAKMILKAQIFKALQATLGFFGLPGLAEGGPAKAGQPYIVGEKGPELFVPKSAGTVVPNNKLAMASASVGSDNMVSAPITNNYITNNINALDAKSVAQLFAENRKALLGSVRTAEKELPYRA
jgi:phage-related minor tail protein